MSTSTTIYAMLCGLALVTWGWLGDPLSPGQLILSSAVAIAVLGVPHGGLDHWVGRRLLLSRHGLAWPALFFAGYLCIASIVAGLWLAASLPTMLAFFVGSAWHFGREEDPHQTSLMAIANGGLVIWLIALFRPDEMLEVVQALVLHERVFPFGMLGGSSVLIVDSTRWLGCFLLSLAIFDTWGWWGSRTARSHEQRLVWLFTALLAIATPLLVSFTLYFCGRHSVLGLKRLRIAEGLGRSKFMLHVAPLSALAITLVLAVAWMLGDLTLEGVSGSSGLRMIFIGLAAIAVPHMLLHAVAEHWSRSVTITELNVGYQGSR